MPKTQIQEFQEDADLQAEEARLAKLREDGSGMTIKQVYKEFDILRDLKIDYNTKKAIFDEAEDKMKAQIARLRDIAEADGISGRVKVRQPDGTEHVFEVPKPTWFATIQDWPAFKKWALKNRPGLIQDNTRVTKGMNELVRSYRDDGRPLPPGLGAAPRPTVKVFGLASIEEE